MPIGPVVRDKDGWLRWPRVFKHEPLPLELVTRELLDVGSSIEELLSFTEQYGVLSKPHPEVGLSPPGMSIEEQLLLPSDELEARSQAMRDEAWRDRKATNHVHDVSRYLTDAQRLARTWVAFMDDEYIWPIWLGHHRPETKKDIEEAEAFAWVDFVSALNVGLQAFHVRAELPSLNNPDWVWGRPQAGLYSALCLQLVNLIAENHEELHTCANETCSRRFIRQRGGAEHGQYRKVGVLFCTPSCASAQKQREYRKRKRSTKNGGTK